MGGIGFDSGQFGATLLGSWISGTSLLALLIFCVYFEAYFVGLLNFFSGFFLCPMFLALLFFFVVLIYSIPKT